VELFLVVHILLGFLELVVGHILHGQPQEYILRLEFLAMGQSQVEKAVLVQILV
jgi:hypothetical protein